MSFINEAIRRIHDRGYQIKFCKSKTDLDRTKSRWVDQVWDDFQNNNGKLCYIMCGGVKYALTALKSEGSGMRIHIADESTDLDKWISEW